MASKKVEYVYPLGQPDIMKPVILSYDGMNFRKCPITYRGYRPPSAYSARFTVPAEDDYEDNEEEKSTSCMDKVEDFLNVKHLPNGQYELELNIPSVFFKYVIGRMGKTRQMIEKDTKAKLIIPRQGEEGPIKLQASTKRALNSAKQRVEVIAWSNRQKEEPTHFVGIALHSDVVQEKILEFKRKVLDTCGKCEGIEQDLFQLPIKMHLTLAVLRLFSADEEQEAISSIEQAVDKHKSALGPDQKIVLRGIDCMNDDVSSVRVLYAKVGLRDGSVKFQGFADNLLTEMVSQMPDYIKSDHGRTTVKLHATVMNSLFLMKKEAGDGDKARSQWNGFDATKIFKEFQGFDFGESMLTEILLLDRRERDERGFYKCTARFKL